MLSIAIIIIAISFSILVRITLNVDYESARRSSIDYSYSVDGNMINTGDPALTEEEYYMIQEAMQEDLGVGDFIQLLYSASTVLLVIFISIFVSSEWDSGFIKNIIPLRNSRYHLLISKNIIVFLFILIQGIISFGSAVAANLVFSGKVDIPEFKKLIIFMGLQFLLRLAFGSFLILISHLSKSKAITISIGILLAVNIHGKLIELLDRIIPISKLSLAKLSLINNMKMLEINLDIHQRIIIISIVYFMVYTIISLFRIRTVEVD